MLFVPVPDPAPAVSSEIVVAVVAGEIFELEARVVQVLEGAGLVLQSDKSDELVTWIQGRIDAGIAGEGSAASSWGAPPAKAPAAKTPANLHEAFKDMSTAEKRQLGLHGDRDARMLLLKDPNKNLQTFVINNRNITTDEVRYIAGYRQANPAVLKAIGENREWMMNPRIVVALVTNPTTPAATMKKLLPKVGKGELRRLAKSQSVPRAVSVAAKRLVIDP